MPAHATIRVAVLTVSDTSSCDPSADWSTIKELLHEVTTPIQGIEYICKASTIVPDDGSRIQEKILSWVSHEDVDWIITTGGIGFGTKDCTPEAVKCVLDREASGLVHLMLSNSVAQSPFAALSRPVAGMIGKVLVVTLPGSVEAIKGNLSTLLKDGLIAHAIELIRGGSGQGLNISLPSRKSLGESNSIKGHHAVVYRGHEGGHQVPKLIKENPCASVSVRQRKSPFPIVPFDQAMRLILDKIEPLAAVIVPVTPALRGHVLAQNVYATQNIPSTSTSNVDGYALRHSDMPGLYHVLTSQTHSTRDLLPPNTIYRINTGAPLAAGTNAVIMMENTRLISVYRGAEAEERVVETLSQVPLGENVRRPGSDVRKGDLVLRIGDSMHVNGGEIGTLAFVGCKDVKVHKKPTVAILSTGNEIIDLQDPRSLSSNDWVGIFDTNRPSLQAALKGMGYEVVDLGIVPDKLDAYVDAIRRGLRTADLLLSTGGTSMGLINLLRPVIERHFNGTLHFGRAAIKPGKLTAFATVPFAGVEKPVFALSGNPASALLTFHIFVLPALRRLSGYLEQSCQLPRVPVKLMSDMTLDSRVEFHGVVVKAGQDDLKAYSTGAQRSSRVASLSGPNAFIILPPRTDLPTSVSAGTIAEALIIDEIQMDKSVNEHS